LLAASWIFRMNVISKLKLMSDLFRVARFQAGAWPIRALPGAWRVEKPRRDRVPSERRLLPRKRRGFGLWAWIGVVCAALLLVAWIEIRTSVIESWLFTTLTSTLTYDVRPGAATVIIFPSGGPLDLERGYPRIPQFAKRLESRGFHVAEQARFSRTLAMATKFGFSPPYSERAAAGLVIRGADDDVVYDATPHERVFSDLSELPPVIEKSLMFVEDRELGGQEAYRNPAVDWNRLAKAALQYAGSRVGLGGRNEGGSTLAVQMEKYRHSEDGRTEDPLDKLRQVGSASLKAYHAGPDTRAARRRIVLDYLNTMPLAAAPNHGEVHGLKEGLRVWFGRDPEHVLAALQSERPTAVKARAFKQVFALLCSVRAPSQYLIRDHKALEARVNGYSHLLEGAGIIDAELGDRVRNTPLKFSSKRIELPSVSFSDRKAVDLTRRRLSQLLDTSDFYALDRLDLEVETTIDRELQQDVQKLLQELRDPEFVTEKNLRGERLLATGDPRSVVYSFALFERTPRGDLVRVHADNLNKPFDVNHGMKMELGSTAKLRTLAHYLDIMAEIRDDLAGKDMDELQKIAHKGGDPLTAWGAQTLLASPDIDIDAFLQAAMERPYSGNPGEMFWTGGGIHYFGNFDKNDNAKILSLREATAHSTNLVFIRLMRDIVRYHTARLPYNVEKVFADVNDSNRARLLDEAANEEAEIFLGRAFRRYKGLSPEQIPNEFLGSRAGSARDLAELYYGWHPDADSTELAEWLVPRVPGIKSKDIGILARKLSNPRFTLADYAYLLDRHPEEIWCAGALMDDPKMTWTQAKARSADAKKIAMSWLYQTKNKAAQDTRLRARIERDAFARMEPSWKKLGFPFESLVPSYATAIGSSADRPDALATLMGIIVDDGIRRTPMLIERMRFASGTPYHTVFDAPKFDGERVLPAPVCRTLRDVLAGVVDHGTASRVKSAFTDSTGAMIVPVGGKTGSGDNRIKAISKSGGVISSYATSRTAAFAFYIGDRYYGVITSSVMGPKAENFTFTSALPLEIFKLAAPGIRDRLMPHPAMAPAPKPQPQIAKAWTVTPGKERDEPAPKKKSAMTKKNESGPSDEGEAPQIQIRKLKSPRHTAPASDTLGRKRLGPETVDGKSLRKKRDLERLKHSIEV
jgi:membrane peptidoglycan carboxypeptidase